MEEMKRTLSDDFDDNDDCCKRQKIASKKEIDLFVYCVVVYFSS